MAKVSIEARYGSARFRVGIQASSVRRAVSLVKGLYSPSDVRVIFPIDPEGFFVDAALAKGGLIERGKPEEGELAA